mmetsp:Transcript_35129/g.113289  ORF Transcript_35129/g.113289 Transcript_35129/m.113289 type:complete len:316 (+) Transcript_35129:59-1006(+)
MCFSGTAHTTQVSGLRVGVCAPSGARCPRAQQVASSLYLPLAHPAAGHPRIEGGALYGMPIYPAQLAVSMPLAPVKSACSIRASLKLAPVRSAPRKKAPFRLPPLKNALSSRASEKFAFSAITPVSEAKLSVALTKLASLAFTPERSDWERSACAKEACLSEALERPTPRRLAPLSDACSKEVLELALAESIIALSSDVNSKLAPCSVAERRLAPSSSAPEKSPMSSLELYRLAPRRSNSRKCVQPESMGAALGSSSRQHTQVARFWQCLPPPQTARRKRPASRLLPGRLTEEYERAQPARGLTRQTTPSRGTIL